MSRHAAEKEPSGETPPGGGIAAAGATLASLGGRARLEGAVCDLMRPPRGVEPTPAHRPAVRLFDRIVTTNYDMLFEEACSLERIDAAVFHGELPDGPLPARASSSTGRSTRRAPCS